MKYICPLITVADIDKARDFYETLLGQKVKFDFGENVTFEGDFAIHLKSHFKKLIDNREIKSASNSFELYFECANIKEIEQKLVDNNIEFIHKTREQPWKQRVIRFYDLDRNIIEVGESMEIQVESEIEQKELKQEGYSIHYYATGNRDNELIIFLHPAFADHRAFDKQIDFFSNHYRVVTIDMLGHGLSNVAKAKDKIDYTIHHINSILQNEDFEKAHFVGVSMGSLIAQYFALHYPDKVQSMTILGGYDINADNKELTKAQRSENIKWIFKALFSMDSFRRYVARVSVYQPLEQVNFYEMAKLFTRKSFLAMSGLGNVVKHREGVKQDYSLLILSGEKDIELAIRMSKKWHNESPSSQFLIIENSGHCANMDNPDEFNRIVMNFLKDSMVKQDD